MQKAFVITLTALVMMACGDSTHDFHLRFSDVHGLKKGDPVYFEESVIGAVDSVEYTDSGDFLVGVSIRKGFASAATQASRFYIDAEPNEQG